MLCENCGVKNATTHLRVRIKDVICDKYLCFSCAESFGFKSNDLSKIMSSLLSEGTSSNVNTKPTRCSCCGSTVADIAKSGKCGCPECYNTFYEQLLPYLKKSQFGGTKHDGKSLDVIRKIEKTKEQRLRELKESLRKNVELENYERAAEIRDRIKRLEEEM